MLNKVLDDMEKFLQSDFNDDIPELETDTLDETFQLDDDY